MANTLVEYGYLSTSVMKKGIIKTIITESPFLRKLPFIEITGNAYLYNLESTEAGAGWYTTGDTWVESTPVWAQRSSALTILGGDADVDQFAKQTRGKDQDIAAPIIELKAKAIADEFEKQAILGYTSTLYSTKHMKGLMHLLAEVEGAGDQSDWDYSENGQFIYANATSGELTLALLDELVDLVKPGSPDVILMNKKMRRKLTTLARASGNNLEHDKDQLGFPVTRYGEIEVVICDHIPMNIQDGSSGDVTIRSYNPATTRATGYDNSVIFAFKWGESGVCGLQNGGIQTEYIGPLETKDAERTRIKYYTAMAHFGKLSMAALTNVLDTAL